MDILVINYTDWVGYHVVNALLNEGHEVFGIERNSGNPMLKDYFIRNSNFHDTEEAYGRKFYCTVGIGGGVDQFNQIDALHTFLINPEQQTEGNISIVIQVPFLFGEFMPMDESGFLKHGKKILFSNEKFKKEGVFIGDFMEIFLEWFESPPENKEILVKRGNTSETKAVILEKTFIIHENMPIVEKLEHLIDHYEQHKSLYPGITPG